VTSIAAEEPFTTLLFKIKAKINEPAILKLTTLALQSRYVVIGTYNFAVSVNGNQLMVLSKNELDVG